MGPNDSKPANPISLDSEERLSFRHQNPVLDAMQRPETYPHPVSSITVQDTHISRVFLTGPWVYKIKKAVDFGFLDFSTLARRRHFCRREVELNRRLTRGVYADVVAITFSNGVYRLAGHGPAVEYAVRMRQLPDADTLSARLQRGAIDADRITDLVKYLLGFYGSTARFAPPRKTDSWLAVREACRQNFRHVGAHPSIVGNHGRFERIRSATEHFLAAHKALFVHRLEQGHVRDGHGDLRSDHIYLASDGSIQIIDCIEFSDRLRQIDIISDLAFLTMDLDHQDCPHYAARVMQTYVAERGDVAGLVLWPFYQCYRAMVRCKVNAINMQRAGGNRHQEAIHRQIARQYLRQAEADAARLDTPVLYVLCGLPGTGKSTLARAMSRTLAIPVYRSDVERRGRGGQPSWDDRVTADRAARYSRAARRQVYDCLMQRAGTELDRGRSVILDATFNRSIYRQAARRLADKRRTAAVIIMCRAPDETIHARLRRRETSPGVSDARRSHLPAIRKRFETPAPGSDVLEIDTSRSSDSCLAKVLIHVARRPCRRPPEIKPGWPNAMQGGHHVQNHPHRHRSSDRARCDRHGRTQLKRPLPV